MPKKISTIEKRGWLEEYERGKSEVAIASSNKRDSRTVKKALEDARRERDAMFARVELMKDALRSHQDTLMNQLNLIIESVALPQDDFAPLSWYEGNDSIFTLVWQMNNPGNTTGFAGTKGRPSGDSTTAKDVLRQHLKNDKLWKLLVQWDKAYTSHISDRTALQRKIVSLLEQKTGYKMVHRANNTPPFLCSYTTGPAVYKAVLNLAFNSSTKSDLEDDIVIDIQTGMVKYHNSILAKAPGNEEVCRYNILGAYRESLESPEFENARSSSKPLDEWVIKTKQAAEEISMLGYIPGNCSVCKRLGM